MTTENQAPEGALTDEQIDALVTNDEKGYASEFNSLTSVVTLNAHHRAIRAALAAPAPQAAPAWQPIETAPRGSGEDGPHDVRDPAYIEPPTLLLWTQEGPRVGYYDWYYHRGYGRGADPHESPWRCAEGGQAYGPTHWMPLPAAPQTKEPTNG